MIEYYWFSSSTHCWHKYWLEANISSVYPQIYSIWIINILNSCLCLTGGHWRNVNTVIYFLSCLGHNTAQLHVTNPGSAYQHQWCATAMWRLHWLVSVFKVKLQLTVTQTFCHCWLKPVTWFSFRGYCTSEGWHWDTAGPSTPVQYGGILSYL